MSLSQPNGRWEGSVATSTSRLDFSFSDSLVFHLLTPTHHYTGHHISKATSTLLEAAEFFADEGAEQYWAFVEEWNEPGENGCHDTINNYIELHAASEETLKVIKLSLSVRNYSPRLEMFRSMWSNANFEVKHMVGGKETAACCFVVVGDQHARTEEELVSLIETVSRVAPTSRRQATQLDHVYLGKGNILFSRRDFTSLPLVTFYGAMGTECFGNFHAILKLASLRGQVHYVHRPVLLNMECARKGCIGMGIHDDTGESSGKTSRLHVVGFGVELALKSMEYKASDDSKMKDMGDTSLASIGIETHGLASEVVKGFNFSRLHERYPELNRGLTSFHNYLVGADVEEEALKIWDIRDLGLQATQRILLADDPLQMMMDISQNLPSLASSLSRMDLDMSINEEIEQNQKQISPGSLVMSINGEPIELDTIDIFTLTDKIAGELREAARFRGIGLSSTITRELLSLPLKPRGRDVDFPRIDLYDSAATLGFVSFNIDVENDREYDHWSPALVQLMTHNSFGQVPLVRRNMFNIILIINPDLSNSWRLVDAINEYVLAGVPLRLACVLVDEREGGTTNDSWKPSSFMDLSELNQKEEDDLSFIRGIALGTAIGRAGNLILRRFGGKALVDFVNEVAKERGMKFPGNHFIPAAKSKVLWHNVEKAFTLVFTKWHKYDSVHADPDSSVVPDPSKIQVIIDGVWADILSPTGSTDGESGRYLSEAKAFIASKGVVAPAALVNGIYFTLDDAERLGAELDQVVMHFVQQEANSVTEAVFSGVLTDEVLDEYPNGMYGWLHREAVTKNTPFIVDDVKHPPSYVEMRPPEGAAQDLLVYNENCDTNASIGNTLWVVADAGTKTGMDLIASVHIYVTRTSSGGENTNSRVAILHPPGAVTTPRARAVAFASRWKVGHHCGKYSTFFSAIISSDTSGKFEDAISALGDDQYTSGTIIDDDILDTLLEQQGNFVARLIGIESEDGSENDVGSVVVANGRVIRIPVGYQMDADDFALLISKEWSARGAAVHNILQSNFPDISGPGTFDISDQYMIACSLVAVRQTKTVSRRHIGSLESLESKHSAVIVHGDGAVLMEAVLDPLSKEAQRIAPLFFVLRDALFPYLGIRIILNPRRELLEMPIKSYYRYAVPNLSFDATPRVQFSQLPRHQTLTAHLDVPEAWLVTTVVATYDLDNLRLTDLPEEQATMHAEYRVEALLITGYCSESGTRDPPRGTQLIIGDSGTVVMSNLGYFQLPAAPGVFELALRPGRSADMYVFSELVESTSGEILLTVEGEESARDEGALTSTEITVSSWQGLSIQISLERRPEMEGGDVLEDDSGSAKGSGLLNKITSTWGKADRVRPETINIFSVASGHLYERFLKIMMLSVCRNTNNPVKFWFIKSWLSPRFKDFLPHFAAKYRFEYELVTYKWPTWLHKQTEKQRIIWAYKLLFLDVLFPLTLNKVIFVDADQVIRSDLKELWEMDIRSAPYAYTPFCDNNMDTEGYRFWKHGFWQTHLAGKPYHISALYIVDLARFRHTAAGDKLRLIYETLSKDPSSLANLDQDLPNYAQHQVPIFSLPQRWLWCESWCGNETKAVAKTIDLCNNPMTKEPKLKGAARIIEEWPLLDAEVQMFTKDVEMCSQEGCVEST